MTFFSAEDFDVLKQWSSAELAIMCNQKLQREGVVVYGYHDKEYPLGKGWLFDSLETVPGEYDTHKALLVCIEHIVRKPCNHEAKIMVGTDNVYVDECIHCSKRLKPTGWEVVND